MALSLPPTASDESKVGVKSLPDHKYWSPSRWRKIFVVVTVVNFISCAVSIGGLVATVLVVTREGFGRDMLLCTLTSTNIPTVIMNLSHLLSDVCARENLRREREALLKTRKDAVQGIREKLQLVARIVMIRNDDDTMGWVRLEETARRVEAFKHKLDACVVEKHKQQQQSKKKPFVSCAIIIHYVCVFISIASLTFYMIFASEVVFDELKVKIVVAGTIASICNLALRFLVTLLEDWEKTSEEERTCKAALLQLERLESSRILVDQVIIEVGVAKKLLDMDIIWNKIFTSSRVNIRLDSETVNLKKVLWREGGVPTFRP